MDLSSIFSGKKLLYILIGGIILLVFLTIVLVLRSFGGTQVQKATIEFWGVFDGKDPYAKAIKDFQELYPNVKVNYTQKPYETYESGTVDALAAGNGPDIWLIHNTWLPKHGDKLAPLPDTIPGVKEPLMTLKAFKEQFVDVAYDDLVYKDKIFALPLYVDTMALYYNKDLVNSAGIAHPPTDYTEFNDDVKLLTKFDASANITQSGAAIGTSKNINRATDLMMALMIQSGVRMTNADNTSATFARSVNNEQVGERSLQYYTDFTNPTKEVYAWNDSLHYSVDAFVEGTAAMMFNYAHLLDVIRGKSARLNFGVAPMPQLSKTDIRTYADYWAPAVTANSKFPNVAWQFIAFLASRDQAQAYVKESKRPAARRDLIELQKNDPDLGIFAKQALSARSWYQVDEVQIEGIFAGMIDDVNLGRQSVHDAIQSAEARVTGLMSRRRAP